ncbi:MAG: alpha/beta hydrolase [Pseudomonadales bacterium]|jgi:acetyl esterase/lipase|nr:alpha/beta hydrolase [Pseudomonadales bacterium]
MASLGAHITRIGLRTMIKRPLSSLELSLAEVHRTRQRIASRYDARPGPAGVLIEHVDLDGLAAERCSPDGPTLPGRTILYLHGGGFLVGSPRMYRRLTARIARATGATVVTPQYRLAPEHPWPAAPADALGAYRALLAAGHRGHELAVVGDSAGGNLVLVLLQRIREAGLPMPASAMCLSPWADLTGTSPTLETHAARDPMLPGARLGEVARAYAPGMALDHPHVSPVHADFTDFPPLLVHAGSEEVLLGDAERVVAAARRAAVAAELRVWRGQPHVFHMHAGLVPEGRAAIEELARFAIAHWLRAADLAVASHGAAHRGQRRATA